MTEVWWKHLFFIRAGVRGALECSACYLALAVVAARLGWIPLLAGVIWPRKNIVLILRIVLSTSGPGFTDFLFLRSPPDPISWTYPFSYLEPGVAGLFYRLNNVAGKIVQAQAEYTEIDGRSLSCAETL